MKGAKRERPNPAILNQAVTTGALPSPHRAHPPAQRVRSTAPDLPGALTIMNGHNGAACGLSAVGPRQLQADVLQMMNGATCAWGAVKDHADFQRCAQRTGSQR